MSDKMPEFRVRWQQCPTSKHPSRVLFIEAANAMDARQIAYDHIERRHGIAWFQVQDVTPSTAVPAGRVKETMK